MRILAIETSCDETAVSIVEATETSGVISFTVLGNALVSQTDIHKEFGGVFPMMAKREHAKALVPMLLKALKEARLYEPEYCDISQSVGEIEKLLEREDSLSKSLLDLISNTKKPAFDLIAVTAGPGLEPALWVGINFAKALGRVWGLPVMPINHMEGHVISSLIAGGSIAEVAFPALALLISGGHTELVLMKDWLSYELIGATRDDAVGEAFDKVARMMGLAYPGGPKISKLASSAREKNLSIPFTLPRPMLHADSCDFSFSGLKTAVLYALGDHKDLTDETKEMFAQEFEDAVTEVLVKKTSKALEQTGARTLIIGGGVSANQHIREEFRKKMENEFPGVAFFVPDRELSTDNAVMIAAAAYIRARAGVTYREDFIASGQLSLGK